VSADIDHEYTDEIVCPWCGEVHGDSWERHSNEGEDDCQSCGKSFRWSRNVTVDYSTEKKEVKP
jgi:hypothetical protein